MTITTASAEETLEAGRRLGCGLRPGQTVCLYGDLGSGKTVMAKGIAEALGISARDITSASFTIIAEYEGPVPFYHIDLYRLEKGDAIERLGIDEYLGSRGIAVIEWADRMESAHQCDITVRMEFLSDEEREIAIEGIDENDWHHRQAG